MIFWHFESNTKLFLLFITRFVRKLLPEGNFNYLINPFKSHSDFSDQTCNLDMKYDSYGRTALNQLSIDCISKLITFTDFVLKKKSLIDLDKGPREYHNHAFSLSPLVVGVEKDFFKIKYNFTIWTTWPRRLAYPLTQVP